MGDYIKIKRIEMVVWVYVILAVLCVFTISFNSGMLVFIIGILGHIAWHIEKIYEVKCK